MEPRRPRPGFLREGGRTKASAAPRAVFKVTSGGVTGVTCFLQIIHSTMTSCACDFDSRCGRRFSFGEWKSHAFKVDTLGNSGCGFRRSCQGSEDLSVGKIDADGFCIVRDGGEGCQKFCG